MNYAEIFHEAFTKNGAWTAFNVCRAGDRFNIKHVTGFSAALSITQDELDVDVLLYFPTIRDDFDDELDTLAFDAMIDILASGPGKYSLLIDSFPTTASDREKYLKLSKNHKLDFRECIVIEVDNDHV